MDLENAVWTIPAKRMKAGKEHRVPLSPRALAIVKELHETRISDYVFPGQRPNRPLSGMAFEMLMRRMKADAFTVHGFRSAFRDWAGDETQFSRDVAEEALAHRVGDATERAYRRADALEKRRKLMGMKLAENEPEFTGQTGKRGRPKLKSQRQKTDYERALFIVRLKARHEKNGDGRKLTDKALIELAQQESHLEFVNREIDSLTKSVSRGNSIIRDAEIKIRKIQAKKLRDSIRDFRQRTKRLKGIEPDSR
jgi:hypothetical protein